MRIEWAIACRFVEVHNNLATMVGAGVDNMAPPQLPTNVGTMVALRIAIAPADTGVEHEVVTKILGPDMAEVGPQIRGRFKMDGQPHSQPGWEGHVTLPMALQWPAATAGAYTLCFSVAGSTFDLPLMVQPAKPA